MPKQCEEVIKTKDILITRKLFKPINCVLRKNCCYLRSVPINFSGRPTVTYRT